MVIALCFHVQKQYKITVSVYGSIRTKCGFGLVLAPSAVLKKNWADYEQMLRTVLYALIGILFALNFEKHCKVRSN